DRPPRPPRQRQGHGMQHISAGLQKISRPPEQQPPPRPHRKNLSAERPPVFVGAPLTQDDLEAQGRGRAAITRKGVFADKGDSPLPNIPAEHWQQLQTAMPTSALINGHPGLP